MTDLRPEILHDFVSLTQVELNTAYAKGFTITGFVENILPEKEILEVRLGNDIIGILPFSEATMYPLRYSQKYESTIPTNVRCLVKKKVRVKVTKISGDEITLSRKQNMLEAYYKLHNVKNVSMHITQVIEKSAFGDIGEGLAGKILINEVCKTHIHHVNQRLSIGQIIDVVMLGVDSEKRFAVSYKQTFAPFRKEDYPIGTIVTGRIGDWIKVADTSKYFVEVTPQVPAILIINKHHHLEYGTEAECVVTGASDKGLYLELLNNP